MRESATLFTDREAEIVRLAALGMGQTEIAERLGTSPKTVDNQLRSVYHKLGIGGSNGAGRRLAAWALQHGFGPEEAA